MIYGLQLLCTGKKCYNKHMNRDYILEQTLFSELRTIYGTTFEDPHTFRLLIKLKDLIDGDVLRSAANRTMERYPYFSVRMRHMRRQRRLYADRNKTV